MRGWCYLCVTTYSFAEQVADKVPMAIILQSLQVKASKCVQNGSHGKKDNTKYDSRDTPTIGSPTTPYLKLRTRNQALLQN